MGTRARRALTPQPAGYVLDAWAILAYLEGEPAVEAMRGLLAEAHASERPLVMTVANVVEVWYAFARKTTAEKADQVLAELTKLGVRFWDISLDLALQAAKYKARHKLSLADCFAAALANSKDYVLVTGDHEFEALSKAVRVQWLARE